MKRVRRMAWLSGSLLWHGKHELTHLLLGFLWIEILSIFDHEISRKFLLLSLVGSLFPDIEHVVYHLFYRRKTSYSKHILRTLRKGKVIELVHFLEKNHKTGSFLPFHHIVVVAGVLALSSMAFFWDQEKTLVFFGAVAFHYVFDMADDLLYLGKLNPNWTRGLLRRSK